MTRIHSDKLIKGMIVQMGHADWRTVTGMEFQMNGRVVYFLNESPTPYVLDGHVNVRDAEVEYSEVRGGEMQTFVRRFTDHDAAHDFLTSMKRAGTPADRIFMRQC